MCRKLVCFASIVVLVGLLTPLAMAQHDEVYDFDGLEELIGDFNKDASVDGKDFLTWQLGGSPFPLSQLDLTDWEDNYGITTSIVDRTDWMTSENWSDGGFDPLSPLLPDFGTRVELEEDKYGANAPVIGLGDAAEAFGVRIGRAGGGNLLGEGLLTMTGGTLDLVNRCTAFPFTCDSRLRVGAAQVVDPNERFPGTFDLSGGTVTTDTLWIGSGSHGEMNMSSGVVNTRGHFYFDWTFDPSSIPGPSPQSSELNMTGGTINVGTELTMHRTSILNLNGGDILIDFNARLGTELDNFIEAQGGQQTPNVTVTISDGLLQAGGFLQIGGSITVDGGILRAGSFNEAVSAGTIEVNGAGLLQFNNANESVAAVQALITGGVITTSGAGLTVGIVDVSGTNFTQVSVVGALVAGVASVPEPSSVVLAMLVSVSMAFRRRNFCGKN